MDEDIAIINSSTRSEQIKKFFFNNKKKIIIFFSISLLIIVIALAYKEFKERKKIDLSNIYNSILVEYSEKNKDLTKNRLIELVNKKDPTYSPLSLYFIIDNKLILNKEIINNLFNVLIEETSLEKEIKNLIIYKKALFNADIANENELLNILNPIINSDSVWKSHALYLMAEYFYSKNEKLKSREFFNQIISYDSSNLDIKKEAQKRLNRDLSD